MPTASATPETEIGIRLASEWQAFMNAPFLTLGLVLLAGVAVWFAAMWLTANKIESLEGRLALRDDRIAEYERKLAGASPDEAKARIDDLERKVADLKSAHRSLTADQKTAIANALRPLSFSERDVEIIYPLPSQESAVFAHDFAEAFELSGHFVQARHMMGGHRIRHFGVTLGIGSLANKPALAMAIARALEGAGVIVGWEENEYVAGDKSLIARLFVDMAPQNGQTKPK